MVKDFLGTPINVGDRALRIHATRYSKKFKFITIIKVDDDDQVHFITDGNKKSACTYPERILVQKSLSIEI